MTDCEIDFPPGWWLIPSMLCGALVWAYIAAGWL